LVLGASSGIGYAIAKLLSKENSVIAVARREERLKEFKNYELFDFFELDKIDGFIKDIVKKYSKLDALIYCAGVQNIKPLKVTKLQESKEIFDINYFAPMLFAKSFASKRVSNTDSSIVFISSIAAIKPEIGILNYSASKAALSNLTIGLAKEIAPIRVNAIAPGFIKTEMTEKFSHIYTDEFIEDIKKEYPLGLGDVNHIADMAEFLVSEKASYVTGEIIKVDGGGAL
jgi:NAD(P)-dependent dehydrogenase (short-subunit alcohol dehydrogenase family)